MFEISLCFFFEPPRRWMVLPHIKDKILHLPFQPKEIEAMRWNGDNGNAFQSGFLFCTEFFRTTSILFSGPDFN